MPIYRGRREACTVLCRESPALRSVHRQHGDKQAAVECAGSEHPCRRFSQHNVILQERALVCLRPTCKHCVGRCLLTSSPSRTADGTTLITSSHDNKVASFFLPQDLLDDRAEPLSLRPQTVVSLAEPTNVIASSPYFDVRYPNTDHLLVACRDHPIHLYPALAPERSGHSPLPLALYRLISPTTEAYIPVHSVVWPSPGTHFLVGARDLIAQFDITRNGDGPSTSIPTIPSRRHIRKGNGIGMRGTVSALSAQTTAESAYTGLVAAGTWTRSVGLYDLARGGECVSTWNIEHVARSAVTTDPPPHVSEQIPCSSAAKPAGIGGAGIMQTAWSPCGRYLLINERQSTGMLIYDVRVTNKVLGFLAGRDALTHQRLSCDVFRGLDSVGGFEVWAGTRNGIVKVWEGVGQTEGCQWPSWDFSDGNETGEAGNETTASQALGSVQLHNSGSVLATCSGCWTIPDDVDDASEPRSRASTSSQSDDESDDDCSSVSWPSSSSSSVQSGSHQNGKKFEKSTLKLWRIGPVTQGDEAERIQETEALRTKY